MKAALDAISAPILVALIPVAVVLKLLEVKRILFVPVSKVNPVNPVALIIPEVAVRFRAPVVIVNPSDAVKSPAEVIVPVPVVKILPLVESVPDSLMVKVGTPLEAITRELLIAALVSLIRSADPVPWLVKVKEVAIPVLLVSSYKVKAISLPSVVVIVLPVLYAACSPKGAPLQ